jgi:hypothetical protein
MIVVEMHMLWWMCGHTRKYRIRNDVLRDRLGVAPVISSGVLQKHQCHSKEYGKYKEGQRTTKVDMDNIGKKRLEGLERP